MKLLFQRLRIAYSILRNLRQIVLQIEAAAERDVLASMYDGRELD